MSSYLLSWNPKNFLSGGEGSDQETLDYQKDEIVRWSCHSKQVLEGDNVYLIKLGKGTRGIIAKGVVTKASYIDKCWNDSTKERAYIDFRVEDIRHDCNEGLIPQVLLLKACPEQQWSPQSSGILIKSEYEETVNNLWLQGESEHSLAILFKWLSAYVFEEEGWYQNYKATCSLKNNITLAKLVTDDLLQSIWLKKGNGIASVGNGFMYQREIDDNKAFLQKLTLDILTKPTIATFNQAFDDWKSQEGFSRTLHSVLHRVFSLADPEHLTNVVGRKHLNEIIKGLNLHFELGIPPKKHWFEDNRALINAVTPFIEPNTDAYKRNILIWHTHQIFTQKFEVHSSSQVLEEKGKDAEQVMVNLSKNQSPLNQILYGPPGTGKTYHAIEASVNAANPDFVWHTRGELRIEYERLVKAQRIRLVTFHQSYGYEEFVEGLCAKTENEQLSYYEKDGIFKEVCNVATKQVELDTDSLINPKGNVWKISIESTNENPAKTYCYENDIAVIGWSETGDLSTGGRNDYFNGLGSNNQNSLTSFTQEADVGDLILCINSKSSIEAIGVITGDYFFNERGVPTRPDFCHQMPVKWLAKDLSVDLKSLNDSKNFHIPTFCLLSRFNVNNTLSYLLEQGINVETAHRVKKADNYVLIIDEINRGNISKIFGELITLIEPSKRSGKHEALEVRLPYSGDKFSVPENLYIIGTMNTADRSLAMMDTALRRRFDFVEMMPQPELFKDKVVKGINLELLLISMNKRIEVLYDREHTLGHAFLIPVLDALNSEDSSEEKAFGELKNTFKNKIIPLLEEYFFEDWNKIRLVLGDNRKEKSELKQYIFVESKREEYNHIFGENHGLETYEDQKTTFTLSDFDDQESAWNNPIAYQAIYDPKVITKPTQSIADDTLKGVV